MLAGKMLHSYVRDCKTCRIIAWDYFGRNLQENYPQENYYALSNATESHDVMRILTLLGESPVAEKLTEAEKRSYHLPPKQRELGLARLRLFYLVQMTFPGVPTIYYGDEAGVEGYTDPYNRGTYPWDNAEQELLAWGARTIGVT